MSSPGASSSAPSRRQKRMGPAPFASFEDLSDELDSPDEKHAGGSVVRLPGIREDATPSTPAHVEPAQEFAYTGISLVGAPVSPLSNAGHPVTPPSTTISTLSTPQESQTSTKMSLQTPSTPRIDISRASSSSHHDSRDSTPERELFEGHDQSGAKLGLAFKEEGTLDLRSSTEELDFQDPQEKSRAQKKRPPSPCLQEDSLHQRKDSQSSEIGLLSISGRTSRLSSIGSQGSTHSRVSNVSHLSIISGQSERSPSPHKMLLETSFCGNKPPVSSAQHSVSQSGTKADSDVLERVLLSRKHDPREAILAEGISLEVKAIAKSKNVPNEKPVIKRVEKPTATSPITITVDKPDQPSVSESNNVDATKFPGTYVSPSGVEYTYIPLKGPLPKELIKDTITKSKLREAKSATANYAKSSAQSKTKDIPGRNRSKSASSSPSVQKAKPTTPTPSATSADEPKYIRIKLKPDHMYVDKPASANDEIKKPACLQLNDSNKKPFQSFTQVIGETPVETINTVSRTENQSRNLPTTPIASPKPTRHILKESAVGSKTPSPSLSRRSSFTSLFKSRETIVSPESPTGPGLRRKNTLTGILKDAGETIRERTRSRSRSKSRDRDKSSLSTAPSSTESIDSKSKSQKSVLSIFKPKKSSTKSRSDVESSSPEVLSSLDGITNVEFKFNTDANLPSKKYYETPLQGESIRIPLHSPTHYENKGILQELKSSSQDSQETVIDTTKRVDAVVEATPEDTENNRLAQNSKSESSKRQSSTSSENMVFSTKLGSNNDIFTTKLPKEKQQKKLANDSANTSNQVDIREITKSESDKWIAESFSSQEVQKSISRETIKETSKIVKQEATSVSKETLDSLPSEDLTKEEPAKEVQERAKSIRNSIMSSLTNEDRYSSESERDSEVDYLKKKDSEEKVENVEPERKGLVYQQDSFEDELPYVPTTLPLERSVAVPIVPIKQRGTFEMRTYPIERPRSTTPINLSTLEDYCEDVIGSINTENITKAIEKLKISLPRDESERSGKAKSPRRPTTNTAWFNFAEKSSHKHSSPTQEAEGAPPPLPPKGVQKEWINFEEIPERRKPPRRIQTIPSRGNIEVPETVLQENVVYSYVNPEDCKCECHEIAREREQKAKHEEEEERVREDEVPLLEDDPGEDDKSTQEIVDRLKLDVASSDRRSVISDSSVDLSMSLDHPESNSNVDPSLCTPFTGDLGFSSNRSSIVSQDEPQSPDVSTPIAFPKTS